MPSAASSDDDRIAGRLGDLFSAVKGPPKVSPGAPVPEPPPPPGAPAGTGGPTFASAPPPDAAPLGRQLASVLAVVQGLDERLAALDRRLDQLEAKVGQAVSGASELDDRLEEVTKALFDWFESFSQWQNDRFDRLDRMAALRNRPS
jgi:hypothetical protein